MKEIARAVLKHHKFVVTTHVEPDGDAVGSVLALYHALKLMGKDVVVCLADSIPPMYDFLSGSRDIRREIPPAFVPECLMVLDCSDLERAGDVGSRVDPARTLIINLDHHDSNTRFGHLNVVEESAATGELVYLLIQELGIPLNQEMGRGIYTAILTDTGGFRYRSTTRRSLMIAGEIVGLGVNPGEIAELALERYPLERFQILGKALRNLRVSCGGKVADFFVSQAMMRGKGISPSIVEGFVNYPREIDGVWVSVFFREKSENQYRVSLRSKGEADVAAVAQWFGGGGHRNAAGCFVEGRFEAVRERVLRKVCEGIREVRL